MFRADSAKVRTYGLVAGGRGGLSEVEARAGQLRTEGWRVRVLRPEADGTITGVPLTPPYQIKHVYDESPCERSDRLRLALERLHQAEPFAVVDFPSVGGWGFRAIQAKRAGLAFHDVALTIHLDGTTAALRRGDRRWPTGPADLEGDFAERYAFENADPTVVTRESVKRVWVAGAESSKPRECAPRGFEDSAPATQREPGSPLVTVCVPYFNLGRHLPRALESLSDQTYPHLEVLVIDDGSTDPPSRTVFDDMKDRYPRFHFLRQTNVGIGATRNRGLALARGDYFLPMDADNVARPDMVARFVAAIHARPEVAAMTCYFLAFATDDDLDQGRFLHAYRPTGGPHVLACLRNVYGDATAICRTEALRAVGGWETDRGTSFEDWEAFVKLVNAGYRLDIVPEHLFYYRHLPTGFSRQTDPFANHERVLRQFRRLAQLPQAEREGLWDLLAGMHHRLEQSEARQARLRYRVVDRLHAACKALFAPST